MKMSIHLAIVGSRDFTDYDKFTRHVDRWIFDHGKPLEIVSGGCSGADSLAAKYSKDNNIPLKVFWPNWDQYGKAAGPMRNQQIIDNCTHLLAFPTKNSRGTVHAISRAEKKGISVTVVDV